MTKLLHILLATACTLFAVSLFAPVGAQNTLSNNPNEITNGITSSSQLPNQVSSHTDEISSLSIEASKISTSSINSEEITTSSLVKFKTTQNTWIPNSFISLRSYLHMNETNWSEEMIKGLFDTRTLETTKPKSSFSFMIDGYFPHGTSIFVYITLPDVSPEDGKKVICGVQNCKYPGTVFELKMNSQSYRESSVFTFPKFNLTSVFLSYFGRHSVREHVTMPTSLLIDVVVPIGEHWTRHTNVGYRFDIIHTFQTPNSSITLTMESERLYKSVAIIKDDYDGFSAHIDQFVQTTKDVLDPFTKLNPLIIELMVAHKDAINPTSTSDFPSITPYPLTSMMTTAYKNDNNYDYNVKISASSKLDTFFWTVKFQLPQTLYDAPTFKITSKWFRDPWPRRLKLESPRLAGYLLPTFVYYQTYQSESSSPYTVRLTFPGSSIWDPVDLIPNGSLPMVPKYDKNNMMRMSVSDFVREALVSRRQILMIADVVTSPTPIELSTRVPINGAEDMGAGTVVGIVFASIFAFIAVIIALIFICTRFCINKSNQKPLSQTPAEHQTVTSFLSSQSSGYGRGGGPTEVDQQSAYYALNQGLTTPPQQNQQQPDPYQPQPYQPQYPVQQPQYQFQVNTGYGTMDFQTPSGQYQPPHQAQTGAQYQPGQLGLDRSGAQYQPEQVGSGRPASQSLDPHSQQETPSPYPSQQNPYEHVTASKTPSLQPQHEYEATASRAKDEPPVYAQL